MAFLLLFVNTDSNASFDTHSQLELDIFRLSYKNRNILDYNITTQKIVYETGFNNKTTRPLKNQVALAKLIEIKNYNNLITNLIDNVKVDRIRIVYCNTYAVFFMKGEKIVHTFFLNYIDENLEVKSFQG